MTTEERVEKLEKELNCAKRRNYLLLCGVALSLGIVGLFEAFSHHAAIAQSTASTIKEIRANKFTVVDENGRTRASLDIFKDAPCLRLYDENGNIRSVLGNNKDGTCLIMYGENSKAGIVLHNTKESGREN